MLLKRILVFLVFFATVQVFAENGDYFGNFETLARRRREGVDYQITLLDRRSSTSVVAIHAGRIEAGTSEIAKFIAGDDLNLYLFEGITPEPQWGLRQSGSDFNSHFFTSSERPEHNILMHITSEAFNEPSARELVARSSNCISVHGFFEEVRRPIACIGGRDVELRDSIVEVLREKKLPIRIESPCERFEGRSVRNIVNTTMTGQGVQIEMSTGLRRLLMSDPELARKFSEGVREGLQGY